MQKSKFSQIVKSVKTSIANHSPEILMGIGITGMLTAGVLAVRGTPKALKLIELKKEEEQVTKLTPIETVKATWKCYIPAVVTAGASTACLIGSARVNLRRNAALATAYKLSESALTAYKEKVVETIGEKKEKAICSSVTQDKVDKMTTDENNNVIILGTGTTLCLDLTTGREFMSDMETLKKAENELNRRMRYTDYLSLNDFYSEIGLPPVHPLGDDLGWNIDKGYIDIHFDSALTKSGQPALTIEFVVAPKYGYSTFA